MKASFSEMCVPAIVYLVMSLLGLFGSLMHMTNALTFIAQLIYICVWTALINWVCSKGYIGMAWLLVFLPIIILAIAIAFMMEALEKYNKVKAKK